MLDLYLKNINTGKFYIYKKNIEEYIKHYKLDSNDLRWEHLYDLCDNE